MSRWTAGLPDAVHVGVGQVVTLPLDAGASGAGNRWTAQSDGDVVAVEVLVATPGPPGPPAPPATAEPPEPSPVPAPEGSPGTPAPPDPGSPPSSSAATETRVLTGVSAGRAVVTLRLGRVWEPEPLATHDLTVDVG